MFTVISLRQEVEFANDVHLRPRTGLDEMRNLETKLVRGPINNYE